MPNNTIGWGQAAANNSNGFGAAAQNNNINWGWIHSRSYGHDETNLVGAPPSFFDQFGTPAAAYSLRDLSGSNPNVIEVRRSSDNAVQDFTASEITNGSLATWVGVGNDGFIRTWYNQTGTNDATQTTASAQPLIVDAGSLVLENGLPASDFDGVNHYLINNSFGIDVTTDHYVFSVIKGDDTTALQFILASYIASANRYALGFQTCKIGYQKRTSIFENVSATADTNQNLITTTPTPEIYKNAILGTAGTHSIFNGAVSPNTTTIGVNTSVLAGGYFNGKIQEIIVFDTNKSADRTAIQTNINDYYSIY